MTNQLELSDFCLSFDCGLFDYRDFPSFISGLSQYPVHIFHNVLILHLSVPVCCSLLDPQLSHTFPGRPQALSSPSWKTWSFQVSFRCYFLQEAFLHSKELKVIFLGFWGICHLHIHSLCCDFVCVPVWLPCHAPHSPRSDAGCDSHLLVPSAQPGAHKPQGGDEGLCEGGVEMGGPSYPCVLLWLGQ